MGVIPKNTSYKETTWKKVVRIILKHNLETKFMGFAAPFIAKNILLNPEDSKKLNNDEKEFLMKVRDDIIF